MRGDDPRHGTVAGHVAHQRGDRDYCAPCIRAKAVYDKRRQWLNHQGLALTVPALGARRRVQALQSIGWSRPMIAKELGWDSTGTLSYLRRSETITRTTHQRIAEVYERLCMTLPPDEMAARRVITWARRAGHAPPLAWDDIDTDTDPRGLSPKHTTDADPVVIQRILDGDWHLHASASERHAVIAAWTGTDNELERLTGWNLARGRREMRDAA